MTYVHAYDFSEKKNYLNWHKIKRTSDWNRKHLYGNFT